jgi:hypothetical protein
LLSSLGLLRKKWPTAHGARQKVKGQRKKDKNS